MRIKTIIKTHLDVEKQEFDLSQKLEEFVVLLNPFNALRAFFQEWVCASPQDRDQQQTKHFTYREHYYDRNVYYIHLKQQSMTFFKAQYGAYTLNYADQLIT